MKTNITELTGAPKHANQHRLSRLIIEAPNDELRQLAVEVEQYTDQLIEALEKAQQRISELESRLDSADKLQDSAFRSGLQHGFSLGQTDDQKGYEQSMSAYSPDAGIKVEAE